MNICRQNHLAVRGARRQPQAANGWQPDPVGQPDIKSHRPTSPIFYLHSFVSPILYLQTDQIILGYFF